MASGGWLGHTLGSVVSAPFKIVGSVLGGGRMAAFSAPTVTQTATAAPAPTASEEAEYAPSVIAHAKKRGKNSLVISSSSGSSGNGTGLNI